VEAASRVKQFVDDPSGPSRFLHHASRRAEADETTEQPVGTIVQRVETESIEQRIESLLRVYTQNDAENESSRTPHVGEC
jgi:hypothetical protein